MVYWILSGILIVLVLVGYIVTLNKNLKIQSKVIEEQKELINRERIAHKYTKTQYEMYYRSYIELVDKFNSMFSERENKTVEKVVQNYDMDDILKEISDKGIKNVSKDKLDYLKKFKK